MAVEVNLGLSSQQSRKKSYDNAPLGCQIFDLCRLANNISFYS